MIPWTPDVLAAINRYLANIGSQPKPLAENERCVNEGEKGCTVKAEANGWCRPCWSSIEPSPPVAAVTEPFDTGCGRR